MAASVSDLFRVEVDDEAGEPVLRLYGELDAWTAPLLDDALRRTGAFDGLIRLTVDAAELSFADARGLSPLIQVGAALPGGLHLRRPGRLLVRLVEVAGLGEVLRLVPDTVA